MNLQTDIYSPIVEIRRYSGLKAQLQSIKAIMDADLMLEASLKDDMADAYKSIQLAMFKVQTKLENATKILEHNVESCIK